MATRPVIFHILSRDLPFEPFMNALPVAAMVLDTDLHIAWLNRAFERLTGFPLETACGICCRHVVRSRTCAVHCPLKSTAGPPVPMESDLVTRDRQRLPVRLCLSPLSDDNGRVAGYLGTIEDLRAIRELGARNSTAFSFEGIIGRSEKMAQLFQTLPAIAQSDAAILITGETGTGKDVVAEAIHKASARASGPFIKINCGALPETLLESELFGHAKGAFTGAVARKPGRLRLAHGGTLFLTEIGDLPYSLQVKLLTFLDDQVIHPLGETRPFHADVRIIAATHRNLEKMVADGDFRQDLLFRLNVARIHLPPLRERKGDLRLLLDHFLAIYKKKSGKRISGFSREAFTRLSHYPFSGNIRELRNIVEFSVSMAKGPVLETDDLPAYLLDPVAPSLPASAPPPASFRQEHRTWEETERHLILDALTRCGGKRGEAAALLGWSRSTLWRKMTRHGIGGSP